MTTAIQERAHWDHRSVDEAMAAREVWAEDPAQWDVRLAECVEAILPALKTAGTLARVAEIGCGIGRLTLDLAAREPQTEWVGFDVSAGMVEHARARRARAVLTNALFVVCDGRSLMRRPANVAPPFDAAYSMVAFQHMPDEAVRGYLADVARRLRSGGVLRFQYVQGEQRADYNHHFPPADVERWCADAGLEVRTHEAGIMYQEWGWVTAVRP